MAKLAAAAARQASILSRISSPKSPAQAAALIHRRGLAGAADHHGPPRINFWQDPMSPSKWKEEHFVIVSLSGWGVLIYGGYKFFHRRQGQGRVGNPIVDKENETNVAKGSKCLKVLRSGGLIRQLSATKRKKIAQQCNSLDAGKKIQQHKENRN
ncbi:hypothetical protein OIU77_006587 [Salix suchowensis]|uniref:Uncharacterized protein n=1 Tax=Salix suchowensis TaxID=1278906 RepID=A0ABQ9AL67_9ROSI|nr:hypothetical protein OIU77_006587 [Salix suchowensis]